MRVGLAAAGDVGAHGGETISHPGRSEALGVSAPSDDGGGPQFSITGHYKNLVTYFRTDAFMDEQAGTPGAMVLFSDLNRLRFSPVVTVGENLLIHGDIDAVIVAANYLGSRTYDVYWQPVGYNSLYDTGYGHRFESSWAFRLKLHRLYGKWVSGRFTVTLGRQQIRFGSGRLWNPLDMLNPISPTFVERGEDQEGIDALRLEYYPGVSTEIALVYAPKRMDNAWHSNILGNRNTDIVGRLRTTIGETDIAILGGRATRKHIGGIDVAAIMWDGMLRGSLVHVSPDEDADYLIASAGYEYTFAGSLYALLEIFYNGNSLNRNQLLSQAHGHSISQGWDESVYARLSNQFLTANRYYLGLVLAYDITPLLRGESFSIVDIDGTGVFWSPTLTYNLLQNLDLSFTAMLGHVFDHERPASDFRELQRHPLFSASAKWYF